MKFSLKRLNQDGFDHLVVIVVFVVLFALVGTWFLIHSLAATQYYQLKMGVAGKSMNLCLDDSSSSSNIISWTCNGSDTYQQWQEVASGSNIMIKNNKTGQCVNDPGAAVGTGPTNRVYATSHACDNSTGVVFRNYGGALLNVRSKVTWSHSGKTTTTNGCLNDPASSTSSGTRLIVYPCDGPGVTTFSQVAVNSGGSSGGGTATGTKTVGACSGTANQKFICRAQQFGGLGYANLGSGYGEGGIAHHNGYTTYKNDCEGGKVGGTPTITAGTNSKCATDCSGFVSIVVDDVKNQTYMWTAQTEVMSGGSWDYVGSSSSLGSTKPGDIAVSTGHVEFVLSRSGNTVRTYGEHQSGDTVHAANMPAPYKVYRWHYQ